MVSHEIDGNALSKFIKIIIDNMPRILNDVKRKDQTSDYKQGFESYVQQLEPSLSSYHHHLGTSIDAAHIKMRYEQEVAIMTVLQDSILHSYDHAELRNKYNWPTYQVVNPYRWYNLPVDHFPVTQKTAQILRGVSFPALMISQALGMIIAQSTERYLGEFYTPWLIAQHLIDLSGFQANHLIAGKRLIDPSCGGGIILIEAAIKTIEGNENLPAGAVLQKLNENLLGLDIQPFAVMLTRTLLYCTCASLLAQVPVKSWPSFMGIKRCDTLLNKDWWINNQRGPDYIIGNPPFAPVKKTRLDCAEDYQDVLFGHPNLYQMFLGWAVKSGREGAKISFLLPQSILTGTYSKKLRRKLHKDTHLIGITRMVEGKGIVSDADQQMLAVCLQIKSHNAPDANQPEVIIRIPRNGDDILDSKSLRLEYSKVVKKPKQSPIIWLVSDNQIDYEILDILASQCQSIAETKGLNYGTGEYVWNRNKDILRKGRAENTVPLVSAVSIKPYKFNFPYTGSHASQERQFSLLNDKVSCNLHNEPIVLIQRTTPRKFGRRLVACTPGDKFYHKYPSYLLENHVNYITCNEKYSDSIRHGLVGWLNSELINFVFQLQSGTTQVSLFELGILPIDMGVVQTIAPLILSLSDTHLKRDTLIQDTNQIIFERLGFGSRHRIRIREILEVQQGS